MSAKLFFPTFELRHSERATGQQSWLARAVDGLRREWRIRGAAESLGEMSDVQLRDLGIARSDIERVIRSGR